MIDDKGIIRDLITRLRTEVDEIDEAIIKLVSHRTEKVGQIARLKRSSEEPIITGWRELEVFGKYAKALGELGKTMASALLSKNRSSPPELEKMRSEDLDRSFDPKEKI